MSTFSPPASPDRAHHHTNGATRLPNNALVSLFAAQSTDEVLNLYRGYARTDRADPTLLLFGNLLGRYAKAPNKAMHLYTWTLEHGGPRVIDALSTQDALEFLMEEAPDMDGVLSLFRAAVRRDATSAAAPLLGYAVARATSPHRLLLEYRTALARAEPGTRIHSLLGGYTIKRYAAPVSAPVERPAKKTKHRAKVPVSATPVTVSATAAVDIDAAEKDEALTGETPLAATTTAAETAPRALPKAASERVKLLQNNGPAVESIRNVLLIDFVTTAPSSDAKAAQPEELYEAYKAWANENKSVHVYHSFHSWQKIYDLVNMDTVTGVKNKAHRCFYYRRTPLPAAAAAAAAATTTTAPVIETTPLSPQTPDLATRSASAAPPLIRAPVKRPPLKVMSVSAAREPDNGTAEDVSLGDESFDKEDGDDDNNETAVNESAAEEEEEEEEEDSDCDVVQDEELSVDEDEEVGSLNDFITETVERKRKARDFLKARRDDPAKALRLSKKRAAEAMSSDAEDE